MARQINGHRSTESTSSIAAAANQGILASPRIEMGPRIARTTSSPTDMELSRPRTQHVERPTGSVLDDGVSHRATWAGNEHEDRHARLQGYTFVRSAVTGQALRTEVRPNGSLRERQAASRPSVAPVGHYLPDGAQALADAPLTDDSARRCSSASGRESPTASPTARPVPLPLGHAIVFTIDGFMGEPSSDWPSDRHSFCPSSPIQPVTPELEHAYRLPALASFGGIETFQNELFNIPIPDDSTPKGSPTASMTPTPTMSTFAESMQRSLADEIGKLQPMARGEVAQAIVNANAHTKKMLAASEELLCLLAVLRKDPSAPPPTRFVTQLPPQPPQPPQRGHVPAISIATNSRPSSIHSVASSSGVLSRASSIRTIRTMIQQTSKSRRSTMLSTSMTAPNSEDDDDDDDDDGEEGHTTSASETDTTASASASASASTSNLYQGDDRDDTDHDHDANPSADRPRWSEERALGSFLQLIERRGITEPEIEALRRHMSVSAVNGLAGAARQSGPRRYPHRAHTKRRSNKKKKRPKKDKERERERAAANSGHKGEGESESEPRSSKASSASASVRASGSESEGVGWEGAWEDVASASANGRGLLGDLHNVAQWYHLHDVVVPR